MIISTVFNIDSDIGLSEIERIITADILHRLKISSHEFSQLVVGVNYTKTILDKSIKYSETLDNFIKYKIAEYQKLLSSYNVSDTCEFVINSDYKKSYINSFWNKLVSSKLIYRDGNIYKFKLTALKNDIIEYYNIHPGFISNNKPNLELTDMILTNLDGSYTDDFNMILTELSINQKTNDQMRVVCISNYHINLYCVNLLGLCLATNTEPPTNILVMKGNRLDNFKDDLLRYCTIELDYEIITILRDFIYDVTLKATNESERIIRPVYPNENDFDFITKSSNIMFNFITKMEQFKFEDAIAIVDNLINQIIKYYMIEIQKIENKDRFDTVIWVCLEMIRRISLLLHPIMPAFSEKILNYFDIEKEKQKLYFFDDSLTLSKIISEPLYLILD